ncbi:hypothetical protein QE152_g32163 [Popillia japonica]|uniref:Uncharacterized protein n=1 Tax=Popillia japonica TaxID=7064 RepID=A0AAW1IZU6_POPJA
MRRRDPYSHAYPNQNFLSYASLHITRKMDEMRDYYPRRRGVSGATQQETSNHNSAQNDSSSTDGEPLSVKRSRWTKSQPAKWKENVMKEKRCMGQPYCSIKAMLRPAKTPKLLR